MATTALGTIWSSESEHVAVRSLLTVILTFLFQKVKMGSNLKRALLHVCNKDFLVCSFRWRLRWVLAVRGADRLPEDTAAAPNPTL